MSKPLRLFIGGLVHETSSFSPLPTSVQSFREGVLIHRGDRQALQQVIGPALALLIVALLTAGLLLVCLPFDLFLLATGGSPRARVQGGPRRSSPVRQEERCCEPCTCAR